MGGNEVWSFGITFRQPKRRRTDKSDVSRDLDERGTKHSIGILYWDTQKPDHDKAYPCFAHISCFTLWKPAKIGIVGKLRSWRIQRRRLQGFWIRTRRGRRDLPGNNQGGLDKEYWHFPFLEAPS